MAPGVSFANYFFHNTRRSFPVDIFGNTIRSRRILGGSSVWNRSKASVTTQTATQHATTTMLSGLNGVPLLTSVLTCQDPIKTSNEPSTTPTTTAATQHIPFKVSPIESLHQKTGNTTKGDRTITDWRTAIKPYIMLTKPRLTMLVTLSSICSYALSPNSVSLATLMFLTVGTTLCSGAANAINMGREPDFDRQMTRTVGRPVVRGLVTSLQAYQFAGGIGSLGVAMLYYGVNPVVAALGFVNIILYGWTYTSLKRKHIINTWIGALVGAIPPLMGWAASSSLAMPGAWCLAGLLYAWQFPHFNALSHNIADQYKRAGYVMTAAENPKLNARVSLRYSLLMFPICFGLSYFEVTDWMFQFDSAIFNGWLSLLAYQFWKQQTINYAKGTIPTEEGLRLASIQAKKLFWASVWQLPAILILSMLHKKGQWDGILYHLGLKEASNK